MTADDEELGGFRLFGELPGRRVTYDQSLHRHIGIAFLPTRQVLGQAAVRLRFQRRPIRFREFAYRDVTPCV
ncbi:hypothetical protein A5758_20795 [Mycobacterium sp. 852014-50255_SCH5639931]|nr:hypothetical protein A5758_20795 [Mycobacterium sp. 852014-50255_SCH5639931]